MIEFRELWLDVVKAISNDPMASQYLREDGEGGFCAAIHRMARDIERLRDKCGEPRKRAPSWQDDEDAAIDAEPISF